MNAPAQRILVVAFLASLVAVPVGQLVGDLRAGRGPLVLDVFRQPPRPAALRAFDETLVEESWLVRWLRPRARDLEFRWLGEGGRAVIVGRAGWLFHRPGVEAATRRPRAGDAAPEAAVEAAAALRDDLAVRGIALLVVPIPNKESIYPDQLPGGEPAPLPPGTPAARAFLARCQQRGVAALNLFGVLRAARAEEEEPLYLANDTHWSPAGARRAAQAVAGYLQARGARPGPVRYERFPLEITWNGDLVRLLGAPSAAHLLGPVTTRCEMVRAPDGAPYGDDPDSPVLVLGDSFLRVFANGDPGAAGFVAQLAAALGRPLYSLARDGGGATQVRQALAQHPDLLAGRSLVIWTFVERDLQLAEDGWPVVTLGPP